MVKAGITAGAATADRATATWSDQDLWWVQEELRARIRYWRHAYRLSLRELAERIAISPQQLHKYETGPDSVRALRLLQIACALKLPVTIFYENIPDIDAPKDPAEAFSTASDAAFFRSRLIQDLCYEFRRIGNGEKLARLECGLDQERVKIEEARARRWNGMRPQATPRFNAQWAGASRPGQSAGAGADRFDHRDDEIHRALGARIKCWRKRRSLSQRQLAQRLGISFQQVHKYESAADRITAARLLQIACVLDAPVASFYDAISGLNATKRSIADFNARLDAAFLRSDLGRDLCYELRGIADETLLEVIRDGLQHGGRSPGPKEPWGLNEPYYWRGRARSVATAGVARAGGPIKQPSRHKTPTGGGAGGKTRSPATATIGRRGAG
jgi:transcriptional regulator with XRE-family HTH domain